MNDSDIYRFRRPEEIMLPFLKLNAKIHKMDKVDIKNKKVNKLKFRPVQDSSKWLMKPYAVVLMAMLRDLMTAIKKNILALRILSL